MGSGQIRIRIHICVKLTIEGFGEKKARIGGFAYPYSPPLYGVFSNVQGVLLQCNARLRLLHMLFDIDHTRAK